MDDHSITIDHEENPVNSEPCISKVHVGLRNVKPEAYKPVLVSIGPYHKANPDLQAIQQNKQLYLNLLIERRNKSLEQRNKSPESREIYLAKFAKFDSEARNCYVDPYPMKSNDEFEFAEMMLLDGCFIVEFLRKMDDEVDVYFDIDDPIFKVPSTFNQILYDMILLENQLPYFVLSKFCNMTRSVGEKPLEEMAMSSFNFMLPRPRLNSKIAFGNLNSTGETNHLLHLIHVFCRPFPENNEESSDDQTCYLLLPENNKSGSDKSYEMKNQMGTVVELQEAGVDFKKFGKIYNGALREETEVDDYVSLFDIDFKRGVMKVPCFKVDDGTETLLRNLIAYEQHFLNIHPKYFTDFVFLMNQLIHSKKDTKVLRFKKIIMNFLGGGDDEVSQLFNSLTDCVYELNKPYYLEVGQKVNKHCETNYNTLMTKLRHDYSKNPWAGLSTLAAAVLLLLTVVQIVVALIK